MCLLLFVCLFLFVFWNLKKAPEDSVPSDTFPILVYKLEILSEVRYCVCSLFVCFLLRQCILQENSLTVVDIYYSNVKNYKYQFSRVCALI